MAAPKIHPHGTKRVSFFIPPDLKEAMDAYAAERSIASSEVMRQAIIEKIGFETEPRAKGAEPRSAFG